MPANRRLILALRILAVMIIGLMALGAGVRAMNAGLSCPDWPLCYGKIIPDFHPAVWFEFVHRAYAGIVSILFVGTCGYVLFAKSVPRAAKRAAITGVIFLFLQIAAGALTVLWTVKWFTVTSHLMLATLFFSSVLWMLFTVDPRIQRAPERAPGWLKLVSALVAFGIFLQIFMGGVVASTFAGSVCVDWPLCNGQWVPTWAGPIGHQIMHRMLAYTLTIVILGVTIVLHRMRENGWVTRQLLSVTRMMTAVVFMQVIVGIANLMLYIPAWLTVAHQSVAVILFATSLRMYQLASALATQGSTARADADIFLSRDLGGSLSR